MQIVIVFAAIVAVAMSAALGDPSTATILRSTHNSVGVGGYKYSFETSDGITKHETAELRNIGTENEALSARGSFSYVLDGVTYTVNYVADENGFHAEGDHLPKPLL